MKDAETYGPDSPAAALTADDLATPAPYEKGAPTEPALRGVVTHVVGRLLDEDRYPGFGPAKAAVRSGEHADLVHDELQDRLAAAKRAAARQATRLKKRRALAGHHHGYDVEYVEGDDVYLLRGPKDPAVNRALKADLPDRNRRWDPRRYDGDGAWVIAAKSHRLLGDLLSRVPEVRVAAERADRERRAAEAAAAEAEARAQREADAEARALYEPVVGTYGSVRVRLVTRTARSGRRYPGVQLLYPKCAACNELARAAGVYWDGEGYSRGLGQVAPDAVVALAQRIDVALQEQRAAEARAREEARRPAEAPAEVAEPHGVLEFWEDASGLRTAKGSVPDGLWREMKGAGEAYYYSREAADDMDDFHLAHDPHWQPGWVYGYAAVDRALAGGYHVRVTLASGREVLATGAGWRADVEGAQEAARREAEERAALRREFAAAEAVVRAALRPGSGGRYSDDEYAPPRSDLAAEFGAEIEAGLRLTFGGGAPAAGAGRAEHWAVELGGASWGGPNLYGSGSWLVVGDRHLYEVRSNGHDGDDWSRSNVRSGLAVRTPRTPEVDAALAALLRLTGQSDDLSAEGRERAAAEARAEAVARRVEDALDRGVWALRVDTLGPNGDVVRSSAFEGRVSEAGLLKSRGGGVLWSGAALEAAGLYDDLSRRNPASASTLTEHERGFLLRADREALRARLDDAGRLADRDGELWRHGLPGGYVAVYYAASAVEAAASGTVTPDPQTGHVGGDTYVVRADREAPGGHHDPYAE